MKSEQILDQVLRASTVEGGPSREPDINYEQARMTFAIDDHVEYPDPEYTITIAGTPVMPLGNLVALSAKWKNGKTFFCDIVAAIFLGCTRFAGCSSIIGSGKVLFFDTEQAVSDTARVKRIIRKMIPEDRRRDIEVFCLRDATIENEGDAAQTMSRYEFIKRSVENEQPRLVIIDGIADLIYNYNDVYESMNIVNSLATLANAHNCCILTVMHQNKGTNDRNMKGHIGTMLFQKCSDVFAIEKIDSLFHVQHQVSRHKQCSDLTFTIDGDGTPIDAVADMRLSQSIDRQRQVNELLEDMLTALDGCTTAQTRSSIAAMLTANQGLKRASAFRKVKKAIDMQVIVSNDRRHYFINQKLLENSPFKGLSQQSHLSHDTIDRETNETDATTPLQEQE